MKFNQYTWNLYKQSPDGQKAIKEFEEANEKMTEYDLFTKYNPYSAQFFSEDYFLDTCGLFWSVIFEEAKRNRKYRGSPKVLHLTYFIRNL